MILNCKFKGKLNFFRLKLLRLRGEFSIYNFEGYKFILT